MYSKAQLLEMNSSPLWAKCIINIENIQEYANIYPTWTATFRGRIYVALSEELTDELIIKYDIMV